MERIKERFEFYLNECKKHLTVLKEDLNLLKVRLPLKEKDIKDLTSTGEGLRILDQIAYRFAKFQESLGRLVRFYLLLKGESVETLPLVDTINLANRYGFPVDGELWMELRILRNSIVHEYPENYGEVATAINRIFQLLPILERALKFFENP